MMVIPLTTPVVVNILLYFLIMILRNVLISLMILIS